MSACGIVVKWTGWNCDAALLMGTVGEIGGGRCKLGKGSALL